MTEPAHTRKLAAILAADVAGYSRLMSQDDTATVRALNESREVFSEKIEAHGGHVIDMAGDSVLAEFASAVEAVRCAIEVQAMLSAKNDSVPEERRMRYRIGVNLGDILQQADGTIYGDGVNIAARLESLCDPGGVTVSGAVHDQVKNRIDGRFEFTGKHAVKNIPEPVRAYRLAQSVSGAKLVSAHKKSRRAIVVSIAGILVLVVAALLVWRNGPGQARTPGGQGEPVVAVLAFANMSGDPEQEYFSDGLTETIIDNLARVRELKVIARNSSFRYKGQSVDVRKVGEELGAKYVVEGSVRRAADTLRVTAQLIDSATGTHLWSKSYDRALTAKDIFAIQDEIAEGIANAIAGTSGALRMEGLAAAKRKPPSELSSYECVLLGLEYQRTLSLQNHRRARDCLEKSIQADADYAALWTYLSFVYRGEYMFDYDPHAGSLDRALETSLRAVRLAPGDAYAHQNLAATYFYRGELTEFKAENDRAIELSPTGSTALGGAAVMLCYAGEWIKGLKLTEQAKKLDPYFPGWYHFCAFHDSYRKREYEHALEIALKINMPDFSQAQALIVAAYGQLGRADEARPYIKRMRDTDLGFETSITTYFQRRFQFQPAYLEHLLDGMRRGGLNIPDKNN